MKEDRPPIEERISDYFDGTLAPGGLEDLALRLREDPAARRRLIAAAHLEVALHDTRGRAFECPVAKPRRSPFRAAVAAAALLTVAVLAWWLAGRKPSPDPALVARAVRAEGAVQRIAAQGALPLRRGEPLAPGESVAVPAGGGLALAYPDGTTLTLSGGSRLTLAAGLPGKQLRLETGEARVEVAPQPAGRPLALATPHARIEVAGTSFRAAVIPAATGVEVTRGRVWVSRPGGEEAIPLPEGHCIVAKEGTPMTPLLGLFTETMLLAGTQDPGPPPPAAWTLARDVASFDRTSFDRGSADLVRKHNSLRLRATASAAGSSSTSRPPAPAGTRSSSSRTAAWPSTSSTESPSFTGTAGERRRTPIRASWTTSG